MSDENQTPGGAAEPAMDDGRRSWRDRVSIVWVLPILAVLISLAVFWRNYADRGPLIEVTFDNAAGVRADETQLRYRDVVVGMVEAVTFTDDLRQVVIGIRVDKSVGPFIDNDAKFWIVRPEVSAQGVSGLDTVLGGVYLTASWDGKGSEPQREFTGLTTAPLATNGEEGLLFQLRASTVAGLSENAPILYRGINVGRVGNLRLGDDGVSVIADAFVREPESQLINSATRFWDTSGFDFSFGASGAQLSVNSLASLVTGGVTFETTVSGGTELSEDPVFRLYPDEESARSSVFDSTTDGEPVNFSVVFEESVPGLEVGADVEFGGIVVGRVAGLTGALDEETFGDRGVRLLTTIEIQPGKMGLDPESGPEDVLDFMQFAVQNGLRAQLQSASLLGGLQVALVQLTDTVPAQIDPEAQPYPRIPSVSADLSDFADTAEGVFNRVNNLPIEEVLDNAILVMQSVTRLLNDDGVTETPSEVLALLGDVRSFVNSEGIQSIPDEAGQTMTSLRETAGQLQQVVAQLNEAGAVDALISALTAAEDAADSVFETMEDGPATLDQINEALDSLNTLILTVNDLPLNGVLTEVEGSVAALRTLLAEPATQGLTGDVSDLLGEVEGLVAEVRASGLVETANATLTQLRTTVNEVSEQATPILEEVRTAIASAQGSIDRVPALLENVDTLTQNLSAVAEDVQGMALDEAVASANRLLISLDTLVSAPQTQSLPEDVSTTLADLRLVFTALTEQNGTLDRANSLLTASRDSVAEIVAALRPVLVDAQRAATAVADAADTAPEVADRAKRVADQIELLVNEAANLPLQEIGERTSSLLASADTLISAPDTQRVPGALSDALQEVQRLLIQVQEGGLIENANATLASVRSAADRLPRLLNDVSTLLGQTGTVVAGYEARGALGSQVQATLRDIQSAASSVDNLARQLERAPNSLLFGR